jgi:hypothetical protein
VFFLRTSGKTENITQEEHSQSGISTGKKIVDVDNSQNICTLAEIHTKSSYFSGTRASIA